MNVPGRTARPALHVVVDGDHVSVRSTDGRVQQALDNVIAVVPGRDTGRTVVAVGAPPRDLPLTDDDEERVPPGLPHVTMHRALDAAALDPELAAAFLRWVVMDARRRLGHRGPLPVELTFPGFDAVPSELRAAFLRSAFDVELRLDGRRLWTPSTRGEMMWIGGSLAVLFVPALALFALSHLPDPVRHAVGVQSVGRLVLTVMLAGAAVVAALVPLRSALHRRRAARLPGPGPDAAADGCPGGGLH